MMPATMIVNRPATHRPNLKAVNLLCGAKTQGIFSCFINCSRIHCGDLDNGSLIKYEKKTLEVVGKRLKKNTFSFDIVNFGEDNDDEKHQNLEPLLSAINNNDGSHVVYVPSDGIDGARRYKIVVISF
ncbi:hypothetical protein Bca4012_083317 [Brassica carinata]|uniref:Uncharacterized protein n=1 Tax=Brassica carinata TaxID=52824 RepID=A0A8X7VAH2_BRACI|nr:hypothetical protein Bca52824_027443 [Brassica carinata]